MSETKKMTNERPVYAFNRKIFCEGMRDGIPIALGYLGGIVFAWNCRKECRFNRLSGISCQVY